MNTQHLTMNAAAIDRFNLVERVKASQAALGTSVTARFEKFARAQGGALYEHASAEAIERAFARFEWAELDRIYTAMFNRLFDGGRDNAKPNSSLSREVRIIVVDKLRRLASKPAGPFARLVGKFVGTVFLAILFMVLSTLTSETLLHFLPR